MKNVGQRRVRSEATTPSVCWLLLVGSKQASVGAVWPSSPVASEVHAGDAPALNALALNVPQLPIRSCVCAAVRSAPSFPPANSAIVEYA